MRPTTTTTVTTTATTTATAILRTASPKYQYLVCSSKIKSVPASWCDDHATTIHAVMIPESSVETATLGVLFIQCASADWKTKN